MAMTFLHKNCAMLTWFSYPRDQKTFETLPRYASFFRLKSARYRQYKQIDKTKKQVLAFLLEP